MVGFDDAGPKRAKVKKTAAEEEEEEEPEAEQPPVEEAKLEGIIHFLWPYRHGTQTTTVVLHSDTSSGG